MAKIKTIYICQECGYESPKWMGKCPECGNWNTMLEELIDKSKSENLAAGISFSKPLTINEIELTDEERYNTSLEEFDRVLGGGIVKGSLILVGGDPGIGKSTLLLQVSKSIAEKRKIFYISGEESSKQIKIRAQRLNVETSNLYIISETNILVYCEYDRGIKTGGCCNRFNTNHVQI